MHPPPEVTQLSSRRFPTPPRIPRSPLAFACFVLAFAGGLALGLWMRQHMPFAMPIVGVVAVVLTIFAAIWLGVGLSRWLQRQSDVHPH